MSKYYYTYYPDTNCYRAHLRKHKFMYINVGLGSLQSKWSIVITDKSKGWNNAYRIPDTNILLALGEIPR